jgi:SAM-dependent methyltransferase
VTEPDYAQMKQRTREMWGMGDYPKIADMIRPAAQSLLDACAISAGQEVLDVAAGSGNLAVLAAEEGADVVASDIAPGQIDLGRVRTEAEGLDVEWVEADAEDLPFEDGRFDCAASVFGAMFAPRPERVASELFRVVKPGGTVGLAVWGPYGAQGEMFEAMNRFWPSLPEGVPNPRDWGDEGIAATRLGPYASSLVTERRSLRYAFDSFDALWATLLAAGPTAAASAQMPDDQVEAMAGAVREVVDRWNQAGDGRVVADVEYLEIVARKRG